MHDHLRGDIPTTYLSSRSTSIGWLPDTGLIVRGNVAQQGMSHWVWLHALLLLGVGVPIALSLPAPFHARLALCLVPISGSIAVIIAVPWWNQLTSTRVIVDRTEQVVRVIRQRREQAIPWTQVVALQVLESPPGAKRRRSCQLNLVYVTSGNEIDRRHLYSAAIGYYVKRLASAYESFTGWPVVRDYGV